jgi:hypothetical protein
MLINDIHIFVKFLKNQGQNIYHTPEQIDDAINRASLDLFRQEEKVFELNQIITDTLRPFKSKLIYSTTASSYDLPSDYIRATNVSHVYSNAHTLSDEDKYEYCDADISEDPNSTDVSSIEKEIDLITDSDWIKRQDSLIVGPTLKNPIARIYGSSIEVLPNTVKPILYYLKKPVEAKWAYTISGDGRSFIFDEANSVDLEWGVISHNEIIEKTIGFLGIALKDNVMMQYEQYKKGSNN